MALVVSAAVKVVPGISFITTTLVSADFSENASAPGLAKVVFQPLATRNLGSTVWTMTLASTVSGFLMVILMPSRASTRPFKPSPPATGKTLRWPMLLSLGTSRHSGMESPAVMLPMLLASPLDDTTMNMHSWPIADGTHWNGPTVISALLLGGTLAAGSGAGVMGCLSLGKIRPAA